MTNSTRRVVFCAAVLAALLPAQDAGQQALARAQLLEQQEGDLAAAQAAYRALLADTQASAQHGEAALRLGTLLWRLDQKDDGKPFLDRAVAAGGDVAARATLVLQGEGEQGKLAQERLAKARAIVERLVDLEYEQLQPKQTVEAADGEMLENLREQLRRLPDGAAALVERLGRLQGLTEEQLRTAKGDPLPERSLAALLWQVGGKAAGEFFARIANDPNVALRRFVTRPLRTARPAKDLEPTLARFAQDPDPTNEVWMNVAEGITRLEPDALLRLLQETHPGPRAAALFALSKTWQQLPASQGEAVVKEHGAGIVEATRSDDGRLAESAWDLLRACGAYGPRSACALFLSAAARFPSDGGSPFGHFAPQLDDAWLHELRVAADQLGRPATGKVDPAANLGRAWAPRDDAESAIGYWLTRALAKWTAAGIDDALRLLDLDYGMFGGSNWLLPVMRTGSPEQVGQVIRRLGRVASLDGIAEQLLALKPAAELFAPLRDLIEACLSGTAWISWRDWSGQKRYVRGREVSVEFPGKNVFNLFSAIGNTHAPAAAAWFAELVDRHPELASICSEQLILLSRTGADGAAAGLRKLLVWPGTEANELQPGERSRIFAELARRGDVEAIPLYPRAYELGLAWVGVQGGDAAIGIGFLAERRVSGGQQLQGAQHGYKDDDLVTAWRTLLESKEADAVWNELLGVRGPGQRPGSSLDFVIPLPVVPLLLTQLQARWRQFTDDAARQAIESNVLSCLQRVPAAAVAGDNALTRALRDVLTNGDERLAATIVNALPAEVARVFATEVRQVLRRTTSKRLVERVQSAGIELPVDDWRDLLGNREPMGLIATLRALPPQAAPTLRREVEATLAHDETQVRIAACAAMQRLYGPDAVASLLPLLQDTSDEVRKTARTCLDELREEFERRSFWAQAKSGVDVSPASAAAKLLAQAKPGEAKEQRLLALRSLAVLGAPEALPYLIDWTKDADAEVCAAARDAIARIHAKAGSPASK